MALFQGANNQDQQVKPQKSRVKSVLRYTMMPEILPRIRAIGFHFGHFAYLLALVFGSARLIPQTHPVMNAANIGRYGVRQVIALAANNITWSTKNIDQIAIFSAIIIGLIMIVIQAGLIAFAAFVGFNPAEAQVSFFSPDSSTYTAAEDPMMIFFAQVFGSLGDFWGAGVAANAPGSSSGIHDGIYAMLSIYSMAMMVIAVIIVLYYIMTVVGEAAKTGTPFGQRFNSLWAPIRLVVALGLLVPLGSGLNSAQYITLWTAKMGSGLGTVVWGAMVPNLTIDKNADSYILGDYQNEWITEFAINIFFMDLCMYAHNEAQLGTATGSVPGNSNAAQRISRNVTFDDANRSFKISYENGERPRNRGKRSCGEMSVNLEVQEGADSVAGVVPLDDIYAASKDIVMAIMGISGDVSNDTSETGMAAAGALSLATSGVSINGFISAGPETTFGDVLDAIVAGANTIRNAYSVEWKPKFEEAMDEKFTEYTDIRSNSWVYAGAWYLELGRLIEATKNATTQAIPNNVVGNISVERRMTSDARATAWTVGQDARALGWNYVTGGTGDESNLRQYYTLQTQGIENEITQLIQQGYNYYNTNKAQYVDDAALPNPCKSTNVTGAINGMACLIVAMLVPEQLVILAQNNDAGRIGSDEAVPNDAQRETQRTMNPMAALMNAGHTIVYRAWSYIAWGLGAQVGGGLLSAAIPGVLGGVIGGIASMFGSLLVLIGALGLTAGLVLFFLLPVLPFIYFFFAIVSWVMEIFEAIVAMPLWALAHLRIDGDGMPGQAAINGYYLLLSILLRPALIVIGLVAGALIFGAAVFLLQELFSIAVFVKDVGSTTGLEWLIYTLIFAYLCYSAAITSFKLVDNIPNQILRWIGSGTPTFSEGKEDPIQGNQAILGAAGAFAGSQLAGSLGQGASGMGQAIGKTAHGKFSAEGKSAEKLQKVQYATAMEEARLKGIDPDKL